MATLQAVDIDDLHQKLRLLNVFGLQVAIAAVGVYVDAMDAQYIPSHESAQTHISVRASDLLRAMGRRSQGRHGGYSSAEQSCIVEALSVASRLRIEQVSGLDTSGKPLGSLFDILDPLDLESGLRPKTLTYKLGAGFLDLVKAGRDWVPAELLRLHPNNDRYAVAVGYYLRLLMHIRRNRRDQDRVRLRTIELKSNLEDFDGNAHRRLRKLLSALDKLAQTGLITGMEDEHGRVTAILEPLPPDRRVGVLRSIRDTYLRLMSEEDPG